MIKLTVTTTLQAKNSGTPNIWFVLEANYRSFDDMHDALINDGCIKGERIYTKDGGFGHRIVTDRVPQIVGINSVATIAPCHFDYVDAPTGAA